MSKSSRLGRPVATDPNNMTRVTRSSASAIFFASLSASSLALASLASIRSASRLLSSRMPSAYGAGIEVRHRLSAASHRHFPLLDARRSRYLGYRATILSCEVTFKPSLPCPLRSPCETLDIFCRRSSQRCTPLAYASRELVLAAGYVYEIYLEGRVLRRGDKPRDIAALEGQIDV